MQILGGSDGNEIIYRFHRHVCMRTILCILARSIACMPSDVKTTKGCQQRATGADFEGTLRDAVWYMNKYLQKRERRVEADELHTEIIRRLMSIEPIDLQSMDEEPMELVD